MVRRARERHEARALLASSHHERKGAWTMTPHRFTFLTTSALVALALAT